jgi:hypothetical protein
MNIYFMSMFESDFDFYKVNVHKDNLLYFQCIICTSFKTKFSYLCASLVHRVHYLAFSIKKNQHISNLKYEFMYFP